MDRTSRETWAKRVERWKESGLTAKEFAAEVGISARSLSWWSWRIGHDGRAGRAKPRLASRPKARPRVATKRATQSPMTFVELAAPMKADALELVLPTSIMIRVRPGFDDTTLERLLDVLERRR